MLSTVRYIWKKEEKICQSVHEAAIENAKSNTVHSGATKKNGKVAKFEDS